MRSMILAVATVASLAFAGVSAEAMPAGSISGAAASPDVTLVGGRCGPYAHRNIDGYCVPNGGYRRPYPVYGYGPGYYRPYARCGIRVGPIGIGGPC